MSERELSLENREEWKKYLREFSPIPPFPWNLIAYALADLDTADAKLASKGTEIARLTQEAVALKSHNRRVEQSLARILGTFPLMGPEVGGDGTEYCTAEYDALRLAGEVAEMVARLRASLAAEHTRECICEWCLTFRKDG